MFHVDIEHEIIEKDAFDRPVAETFEWSCPLCSDNFPENYLKDYVAAGAIAHMISNHNVEMSHLQVNVITKTEPTGYIKGRRDI